MAALPTEESESGSPLLPQVLKAIRRRRGMSVAEVARAMGMPVRSYSHFESGLGRLNMARVHLFSQIVSADPYAILIAIEIKSPAFAVRCIDNQFMSILLIAIQDFDAKVKDDIARLDPRTLIADFTQLFDGLAVKSRELDAYLERWMLDRSLHGPSDSED